MFTTYQTLHPWSDMDSSITLSALHVFVALLLLNAVRWLLFRSKSGFVHQHKTRLALEIASLRKQAEQFNTPSTYVKCAKFQRLANAKEKELAALQAHKDVSLQDRINTVVSTTKVGHYGVEQHVVLLCWHLAGSAWHTHNLPILKSS